MTIESSKKNIGVLYGLLNAGAAIVFTVILYLGGAKMFVSPIAYVGVALPIVFCVLGALQQKKQQGGYLEFGEGIKVTFQILVIGSLIATLFQFALFNYIDVPFRQALAQESAGKAEQWMQKMGMPQEKIDEAVDDILNGNSYTLGKLFLGFAFGCIWWFIVALIVSAIVKKKRPPFENSFKQV
jgi:hypothetical protein